MCPAGGDVKWHDCYPQKLILDLPAILGIYPKELKAGT
jgi:hypothetical protein